MRISKNYDKYLKTEFRSWYEYIEYCEGTKKGANAKFTGRRSSHENDNASWRGCASLEVAIDLAKNGWAEGAKKANDISNALFTQVSSLVDRPKKYYDTEGYSWDMGRVLGGDPECWMRRKHNIQEQKGKRVLKIVFNCTQSAGVDAATLIAKGAVIGALVRLLELSGTRVELWSLPICTEAGWGGDSKKYAGYECKVLVKRADQRLDVDRMAFAIGHPASLRYMGFAAAECTPDAMECISSDYGMPSDPTKEHHGDIYIGSSFLGEPSWKDMESTKEWVMAELAKQGVKLKTKER